MSFYHTYRPRTFLELEGQEHIRRTLQQSLEAGRSSHAYLFTGPRGTGKTSTARILAKALNCQNLQEGSPCNSCELCKMIDGGQSLDVIEIDAASNRGIDEIRELRENVRFAPSLGSRKIFIIDEVHMLTKEAFNALLKTLEEPPEHAVFILATTEPHRVPATVASRCQRFDFGRVSLPDLVHRIEAIAGAEKIALAEGVAERIAEAAEGGFRDAITLLEQLSTGSDGTVDLALVRELLSLSAAETAAELYGAVAEGNLGAGLRSLERYTTEGGEAARLGMELLRLGRLLLLAKIGEQGGVSLELGAERLEVVRGLAARFELGDLLAVVGSFQEAAGERSPMLPTLPYELVLFRLIPTEEGEAAVLEPTQASKADEAAAPQARPVEAPPKKKAAKPAPATQTAPRRVSGGEVKEIEERWPEVIEKTKGHNHGVAACLQVAQVQAVEGDLVRLSFPYKFHRERIDELKNRRMVEQGLSEIHGRTLRIEAVLGETPPPPKEDLVEAALEIIGGEVIG